MGTKIRALYQRRKERDLFDLYTALNREQDTDIDNIITCYQRYMEFSTGTSPTKKQYLRNMIPKIEHSEFYGDTKGLLRPDIHYDHKEAWELIRK